jgi:outer membrane protein
MKRILLPVVVVLSSLSLAQAQKMTMQECVKIGLDNNLTVKRGVYNVESNQVGLLAAAGNFLPTLNFNVSGSQNYGRNLNPVTYQYFQGITKTVNPSLTGQLILFNGLRYQHTYRQNKMNVQAADLDLEKAKNDVIIAVVQNYTNVILNKELYENAKFQLNSSQQQLERIIRQVEAGALSKSNELTQEATVATNETNLITQENLYSQSLLILKQSMQVPASTPLEVVVPDIAMEDLAITQTPEEIYSISAQTLPQVKSALLKVEAAQSAVRAARAAYYPRISFTYAAVSNYNSASDRARYALDPSGTLTQQTIGYVGGDPTKPVTNFFPNQIQISDAYHVKDQLSDNLYKNIGLSLSIPIANGLQTRTNVQQSIINRELAAITVKETENALRQSIELAYNNVVAAAKTYTAAVKQVSANEEAFRMTQQRQENGAATYIEYQVASNDLFSAKSGLARAKYTFILTKKILEFYQGKTIEY